MITPEATRWFFFNVILALTPLAFSFLLVLLLKFAVTWHEILKDGELFIFSTTLSAGAIGESLYRNAATVASPETPPSPANGPSWTVLALMIVLLLTSGLFAVSTLLKFKKESPPDQQLFSIASITTAIFAVVFSFVSVSR